VQALREPGGVGVHELSGDDLVSLGKNQSNWHDPAIVAQEDPVKRLLKILGVLTLLGLLIAGGIAAWAALQARSFLTATPAAAGEERVSEIPRGASGRGVAELLAAEGIVTDAERFYLLLRYRDAVPGIRAGEFTFRTDWTPDEVITALHEAPEVTYPLSIPEGLRFLEIAERVEAAGRGWSADTFLALVEEPALRERMGVSSDDLEGYLYPETYRFARDADERAVIEAMLGQFEADWGEAEQARAEELGMTRHEVVILASLVEKETAAPVERPQIASVFHNRLKIGMKLECDPTIVYGIENYDGIIHKSDIRNPHAWNTYVHPGLPKGPIANPGRDAIQAVLHPDETRYLYFVSKNDGTHHFSTNYAEHNRMVQRYQR